MTFRKTAVLALFIAIFVIVSLAPHGARAQFERTQIEVQTLSAVLSRLKERVRELRAEILKAQLDVRSSPPVPAAAANPTPSIAEKLARQLRIGAQGEDVLILQALLAADSGIYPEGLTTGYFGTLTEAAVVRFQSRNGISPIGLVGPQTLGALNEILRKNEFLFRFDDSSRTPLCAIVPGGNIPEGWRRTREGGLHVVPVCGMPPLAATNEKEVLRTPSPAGSGTTTVDISPPSIEGVRIEPGPFHATVSWTTNEPSDSRVAYGETVTYGFSTALLSILRTGHSRTLTGLNASTTYHFEIHVRDARGNATSSPDQAFTTADLPPPDTAPPLIRDVSVSASSTTVRISWFTDEVASSRIYYASATSSLDLAATSTRRVIRSALATDHFFDITALQASSTYYYVIESSDAANNISTSTTQSFRTTD
ncbi:MAG: fibronectin type III domain-containing protein [Candidatus Liptonbacteria bacterium]|nr:fibronectin type III domain-containing protein [Candidatus Liptonbacteria bacterium]